MTRLEQRVKDLGLDPQEAQLFMLGVDEFYKLIKAKAHPGEWTGEPYSIYLFEIKELILEHVEK
jgi:hypothetical protein